MNEAQKTAALAAVDAWAAPLIADASVFTRGSYESFLAAHKEELVEAIGNAVAGAAT